jgi:hypothetical protein
MSGRILDSLFVSYKFCFLIEFKHTYKLTVEKSEYFAIAAHNK